MSKAHKDRGFKRIFKAFFYSVDGIKSAFIDEAAFRQVVLLFAIFVPLGLFLGDDFVTKALLIFPFFLMLIVELLNSAIENVVDMFTKDFHHLAKKAKDMGSAAQLFSLILAFIIWGIFIFEYLDF